MLIATKGRHFIDALTGEKKNLAGSHTWNTVQPFNGETVSLNKLVGNFTRLWTVETRGAVLSESPWGSTSEGKARVGLVPWKEDGSLNKKYYNRLEQVVKKARRKDIVTGVILFDHAFNAFFPGGWSSHPLNGLGPSDVTQVHTKGRWNKYQRAHVKKTIQTLEPYGNVIYEVGNELHRNSVPWFQRKVIKWVKKWTDKPVGVSYASGVYIDEQWMNNTGADWAAPNASPRSGGVVRQAGFKGPQVLDTDHGWALRSNVPGLRAGWQDDRPLWLMDGLDGRVLRNVNSLAPDRAYIDSLV